MISKAVALSMKILDPRVVFTIFILYVSAFVYESLALFLIQFIYCMAVLFWVYSFKRRHNYNNGYQLKDLNAVKVRYVAFTSLVILLLANLIYSYINNLQEARYFAVMLAVSVVMAVIVKLRNYKLSAHVVFNGLVLFYFGSDFYYAVLVLILLLIIGACRVYASKHSPAQILWSILIVFISVYAIYI